jgi:RHS repeat-associated protein
MGHVNDPDIGLVYMQARYYDPAVGRFLSVDPIGATTKFNRYAYASNNQVINIDHDGMPDIPFGDCSKNPNCSYSFIAESNGAPGGDNSRRSNTPVGTPKSMEKYFMGTSASDRINAAMAVMDYFGIDYNGVHLFYDAHLRDLADTLKDGPNGDGQTTIGERFFKLSFLLYWCRALA